MNTLPPLDSHKDHDKSHRNKNISYLTSKKLLITDQEVSSNAYANNRVNLLSDNKVKSKHSSLKSSLVTHNKSQIFNTAFGPQASSSIVGAAVAP